MPSKRKVHDAETDVTSITAPKRQRVSRACDQCRRQATLYSAREKCDGVQPQCFSCVTLSRQCTYNVAPKKRGVQTGLIRTLELALVWLFDQVPGTEEKLAELLAREGDGGQSLLLDKDSDAGNRLHKRWRRCRVHKDIDRLLSGKDGISPRQDTSGDETDAEADSRNKQKDSTPKDGGDVSPKPNATERASDATSKEPNPRHRHDSGSRRQFKLPRNFPRLLDVYYSYTHSWLPILNSKEVLDTIAASYPPDGLDIDPEDSNGSAAHAELWCALAVGAFQDAASSHVSTDRPSFVFAAARSLIPMETDMALGHVKALLVLSLVKLGQDNAAAASLLIGLAVRGAMALTDRRSRNRDRNSTPGQSAPLTLEANPTALDRVLMACLVLDTIVSLGLGQTPHMRTSDMKDKPTDENGPEEWAHWVPRIGFGSEEVEGAAHPAQSLSSFNQLYQFFRTLNQSVESGTATQRIGAADLVQVLDPRFSFCNSVVFGASTIPKLPSAFLIQATFLGATLTLMADARVSLIWSLMEVLENSIANFGAAGVSPLLVTYMSIANTKSCVKALRDDDKARWNSIMGDLVSVWQDRTTNMDLSPLDIEPGGKTSIQAEQSAAQFSQPATRQTPHYTQFPINTDSYHSNGGGFLQTASSASPSTARTLPFTPGSQLDAFPSGFMGPLSSSTQAPYLMGQGAHGVDYDAIMDELASIDCTDSMEADPQFMANLGFAPGSDLTDMLRSEFGGM
ncbi:quinic acid utilization activator [Colletotrichum truncatum]|uniref:Quinic acid utilization activator n=1 Tax=Colletotrichum truncatum TaxID=5467 RepID=A0ACC3YCU9_COLTU|nr:quinic acid utilization activator [Colletotrichum truncatum]KAF6783507.1 quinic acid utilization activator [Colletotrichum truncatum]